MAILYSLLFAAFAAAAAVSDAKAVKYTRCGTADPTAQEMTMMRDAVTNATKHNPSGNIDISYPLLTIPTYFHVVETQASAGTVTLQMVRNQLTAMNNAYRTMNIQFALVGQTYDINDQWARAAVNSQAERNMRNTLQRQGYGNLNLYFLSNLNADSAEPGLLGYCRFPVANPSFDQRLFDGCLNIASSMPGGALQNFNLGSTAVHEIGHWLGVFHVFQGNSCFGSGDDVSDTPAQQELTEGCPQRKDSCPGVAGLDSIHNFMDYSYDSCLFQFTNGQSVRARQMYSIFRAGG